jgi:glycine oxidase
LNPSRPSDIIVIGAGVVGCSVACELARRGASVRVLDDRPAGMGATQASAGMLAPFTESKDRHDAFLELAVRSLDLYDGFVASVASAAGAPIGYQRTGTLEVATSREHMADLEDLASRLESRGVALRLLDARAVRAEEPHLSADVAGGLFIEPHGFVNAGELTRALSRAARCHGARAVEGARARRISRGPGGVVVETTSGEALSADAVVLAAGSWSAQLEIEGVARPPVRPVRGQLLHLAWQGTGLRRVLWGEHCYMVPWPDGTLLVGATMEEVGFDERTTVAGVRGLLDAACALVPEAAAAGLLSARAGLRPGSPDAMPIIGPSRAMDGLVYATGHFRNGVLLAPITAQLVADAMLSGRMDAALEAVGPQRFEGL